MSDDKKNPEDLSEVKIDLNLLTYRLTAIESKIDSSLNSLSKKIDEMISHYTDTKSRQALVSQSLDQAKDNINRLEEKVIRLETEVVNLKVTFAEKLAFGGIGGGAVAILIQVIQKVMET
jgi:hypothetical protein